MANDIIKFYGEVKKVDEEQRMVYGVASTESVDSQGEVITKACIQDAWDDYMKFANVREMHQPSAVGIVKEFSFEDDGVHIGVEVVDDDAWKKVQKGVYRGFSVGGKRVPGGYDSITKTITKMRLNEISLVDRPANPDALITVFKGEDIVEPAATATVPADSAAAVESLAKMLTDGDVTAERLLDLVKADKAKEGDYGDVTYADTKNKTYPIDTEKHIRAAWSYINMPKNQTGYTSEEVDAIKNRIIAAWKKTIDKEGPPAAKEDDAKKAEDGNDIAKGMWDIPDFARVLAAISSLASCAQSESVYEGDNSPMPAALRDWLADGVAIFNSYVKEETDEMLATLNAMVPAQVAVEIAAGDLAADVRKRLSEAGEDLPAFLDIAKAHMPAMDVARLVTSDGFAKATDAVVGKVDGGISKMAAERDEAIAKMATMEARIAELEAQPAPSKATLRVVVEKAQDIPAEHTAAPIIDVVKDADGNIDGEATALNQIRKIHQSGGSRGSR